MPSSHKILISIAIIMFLIASTFAFAAETFSSFINSIQIKIHTYNGSVVEHQGKQGLVIKFDGTSFTDRYCMLTFPGDAIAKVTASQDADGWANGIDLFNTMNIPGNEVTPICWDVYQTVAFAGSGQAVVYDSVNLQWITGTIGNECAQPVDGWGAGWYTLKSDPNLYAYCQSIQISSVTGTP